MLLAPLFGLRAQTIRYIHTDALGSVAVVTDANRNVIERREYEPYGAVLTGVKDGPGYTGHVLDAATGMSYMQQRYYDPGLGRFLSVDPMATDLVTAWNFNRYIYAASNPYKFTDPDGRVIRFAEGTPADFMRNFAVAIRYLNEKGVATPIGMAWSSKRYSLCSPHLIALMLHWIVIIGKARPLHGPTRAGLRSGILEQEEKVCFPLRWQSGMNLTMQSIILWG